MDEVLGFLAFFFLVSFISSVIFKEVNKTTKALMSEREEAFITNDF